MTGLYELKKNPSGKYSFALKAGNGETVLASEVYNTKAAAANGIKSVQTNSVLDERFEKKVAKNGKPYFVLKAGNHQIIGTSELYNTEEARDKGIAAVKKAGPAEKIKELEDK
ncbi:MAG: YegP family protein [Methylobacteriaceae bacterium]|jgi:uncharacterized protein YegP (UPF0339 family)|nr:YegP family protein [Methylobacteriaceae bacterium]